MSGTGVGLFVSRRLMRRMRGDARRFAAVPELHRGRALPVLGRCRERHD